MNQILCSLCNRPHRTTACSKHCQRCNELYEKCECMEYYVTQYQNRGYSIFGLGESPIRLIRSGASLHRHSVAIEIGEEATYTSLKELLSEALRIRDNLLRYQGPWQGGGINQLLIQLDRHNNDGISYADLAKRVNKNIFNELEECVELELVKECWEDFPAQIPPPFSDVLAMEVCVPSSFNGGHMTGALDYDFLYWAKVNRAHDFLTMLGMSEDEARRNVNNVLKYIRANLPRNRRGPSSKTLLFTQEDELSIPIAPVSNEMIRSKLRNWRTSKKGQAVSTKREYSQES